MSKQDIKIVQEFNTWRKGGSDINLGDGYQKRFGEALDEVVSAAERCEILEAAIRQTLEENGHLADGENCTLRHLKKAIGIEQCKKCGADMQRGLAIEQTFTGSPDFAGGEVCTISPGGSGKIVECRKCHECGWSVTK